VRERIEYRFRVPSTTVFTLYSYSKATEHFVVSRGLIERATCCALPARLNEPVCPVRPPGTGGADCRAAPRSGSFAISPCVESRRKNASRPGRSARIDSRTRTSNFRPQSRRGRCSSQRARPTPPNRKSFGCSAGPGRLHMTAGCWSTCTGSDASAAHRSGDGRGAWACSTCTALHVGVIPRGPCVRELGRVQAQAARRPGTPASSHHLS
jgi:hypothetical protein